MIDRVNPDESDFVKNIRNTHCNGCLNDGGFCNACAVLDCWLRHTYLPEGEWSRATKNDIKWKLTCQISDEINKKILKEIL